MTGLGIEFSQEWCTCMCVCSITQEHPILCGVGTLFACLVPLWFTGNLSRLVTQISTMDFNYFAVSICLFISMLATEIKQNMNEMTTPGVKAQYYKSIDVSHNHNIKINSVISYPL